MRQPRIANLLLALALLASGCGDSGEAAGPAAGAATEDDSALIAQLAVEEMFGWPDTHGTHEDVVRDAGAFVASSGPSFVGPLEEDEGAQILEKAGFVGGVGAHYESPKHDPEHPMFAFAGVIEVRDEKTAAAEVERVIEAAAGPCPWACVDDEQALTFEDETVRGVRLVRGIRPFGDEASEIDRAQYSAAWSVGSYVHLRFLNTSPEPDREDDFVDAVEAEVERTRQGT